MQDLIQEFVRDEITNSLKATSVRAIISIANTSWQYTISATKRLQMSFKKAITLIQIFKNRIFNNKKYKVKKISRTLSNKIILKKWFKRSACRRLTHEEISKLSQKTQMDVQSIRKWMHNAKFRQKKADLGKERVRERLTFYQEKVLKRFCKNMPDPQQKPTSIEIQTLMEKTSLTKKRLERFFAYKRFMCRKYINFNEML
jgi:hypothetical protein